MSGTRRQSRILALQLLYQTEFDAQGGAESVQRFWKDADASERVRRFAHRIFESAQANREAIDALLGMCLENWRLSRLTVVVRSLLRLGAAEMIHLRETPHVVVIDEAVSLAREFVDEEAAALVNGVLQECWNRAGGDDPAAAPPPLDPPPAP
jgi:N utilization substance protein B